MNNNFNKSFYNKPVTRPYNNFNNNGDRIFWAPFLVGGLAGTALGYGIANNNRPPYYYPPVYFPPAPMPYYNNNYYY